VGVSERRERKEPRGDKLEFDGVVEEALPNAMFRVKADNGLNVLATISGRCGSSTSRSCRATGSPSKFPL
jgi:hypothetical protein